MEFTIKESKKKKRDKKPHYIVNVEFMEGDADGYQSDRLKFYVDKEGDMVDLERFVLAVAMCCAAYPHGRGGYDEYHGLPEYDAFFAEEIDEDFYGFLDEDDILTDDELRDKAYEFIGEMNPRGIGMEHPSDSSYISTSFDSYNVVFVDSKGNKAPVDITFTEEEEKKILEAKNFFN